MGAIRDKINELMRLYLPTAVLLLLSAAYLALTSAVVIEKSGKTLWSVVVDGTLAAAFGIIVNYILREQGLAFGEDSDEVKQARKAFSEAAEQSFAAEEELEAYCEELNVKNMARERRKILGKVGLNYTDFFDEEGKPKRTVYTPEVISGKPGSMWAYRLRRRAMEKKRVRAVDKAVNLVLTELTAASLTSEDERQRDLYDFGPDKKGYRVSSTVKNVLTKTLSFIVMGLYTARIISEFSWAVVIWNTFHVILVLAMGAASLILSRDYMVTTFAGRLKAKTNIITKFLKRQEKKEVQANELAG